MKVRAKKLGYHNHRRYREGEVFELSEGFKIGSWMEPVESSKKAGAKKAKAEVVTEELPTGDDEVI